MSKTELTFEKPVMNAAGILGFSPDPKSPVDLSGFGAFVTNPVSLAARTPAKGERCLPYPGGFLLHTGYPNPGLKAVIRGHARRWARAQVPVIVHLLAQEGYSVAKMVERLEGLEGLMGVEIGLPPDTDPGLAGEMVRAALGELSVIVRIPFEAANHNPDLLESIIQAGANGVSLAPPRGALIAADGSLQSGRLYGPAIFPQALNLVKIIAESGVPIIAAGGVYDHSGLEACSKAGALAVQLDAVLWQGSWTPGTLEGSHAL